MPFTIEILRNHLRINKHRLDDELEVQPQLMHEISESLALASAKASSLKEALEKIEAELGQDLRRGETKKTVAEVQAEILLDPLRENAFIKYLDAKREHERWLGMFESWKQRGFSLKTLADLYMANYFAIDSGGRSAEYSQNRKAMSEARTTEHPEPSADSSRKTRRRLMD